VDVGSACVDICQSHWRKFRWKYLTFFGSIFWHQLYRWLIICYRCGNFGLCSAVSSVVCLVILSVWVRCWQRCQLLPSKLLWYAIRVARRLRSQKVQVRSVTLFSWQRTLRTARRLLFRLSRCLLLTIYIVSSLSYLSVTIYAVSSLSYLSVCFLTHFQSHACASDNFSFAQSAHHYSTKTALLHTMNCIFHSSNWGQPSLLVSLDKSAAFDTIDHDALLNRLCVEFDVSGSALSWLQSYLTDDINAFK